METEKKTLSIKVTQEKEETIDLEGKIIQLLWVLYPVFCSLQLYIQERLQR